jgi:hypothetical protein
VIRFDGKERAMPSPFPGMNPYLEHENNWRDFHNAFCTHLREALVPQVRPAYFVKIEENLYVHDELEGDHLVAIADVGMSQRRGASEVAGPGTSVLEAPVSVDLAEAIEVREPFLEVRTREGRRLVAVIELLSPTNKRPGRDREQFLAKRANLLRSDVHYIEIDLLRAWGRLELSVPPCDYGILVSRAERREDSGFWPIQLRDRLPRIPVPLRSPHDDAAIELQEILNRVYDAAGYEDHLYDAEVAPPLAPSDATWARGLVPRQARSTSTENSP